MKLRKSKIFLTSLATTVSTLSVAAITLSSCGCGTTTYSVTYGSTPAGLTFTSNPKSIAKNTELKITYTISSDYELDESNTKVLVGTTDITSDCTIKSTYLIVPADKVTGNITINLSTQEDKYSGEATSTDGTATITEITESTSEITKVAVDKIILIAPVANATEVNVTLSGNFKSCQILINDSNTYTYNITLNSCTISNVDSDNEDSELPFLVDSKKATINLKLATGTTNTIKDKRTNVTEGAYSNDATFKSKGSVTISGSGSLYINNINTNTGSFSKGLQLTKGATLTINDSATVNVFALDTAIQAAGAINIGGSATVIADSYYDDGIKTKFDDATDDFSYKGKTGGNITRDITISDGANVTVYSARNGINAAHDFITSTTTTSKPTINCYTTSTYASGKVASLTLDEQNMYIAIPSSAINYDDIEKYYFTIDFYSTSSSTKISSTEVMTLKKIRKDNEYYFFKCDRPLDGTAAFKINRYSISDFGQSSPTTGISSNMMTISSPSTTSKKDCVTIKSIGSTIETTSTVFDTNYNYLKEKTQSGGPEPSETFDETIGSKGIKAKNNITIPNGTINIKSGDTCVSASYGDIYVASVSDGTATVSFGTGNITISNAEITCESSEADGVKAYGIATISSGSLTVNKAVEALEAGVINIAGGTTKLSASDDGMNASQTGKYNTDMVAINISGGILDVQTTSTNDTDAIDSNNTISITGGLIISRVPGSHPSSSLDWETGNIEISNATIVLMGETEQGKTLSGGTAYSVSGINSSGDHKVTYYTSTSTTETYKFTNSYKDGMNSTITVSSNLGKPTFN